MTHADLIWLFGPELGAPRLAQETMAFLHRSAVRCACGGLVIVQADRDEAFAHGDL
ncbi:MAG: hypothetical protein ACYDCS_09120 [Candidatus Dormibacteria bacterium]